MYSAFGDLNEPQSAAFGPQKHRKLFFNPETLRWEPVAAENESAYDKAFASNSAKGAFPMFGRTQEGSDMAEAQGANATDQEQRVLSPFGDPQFSDAQSILGLQQAVEDAKKKNAQLGDKRVRNYDPLEGY